ncbi:BppU family phage baseplate upper protein (plasmid) [Lacticaseibacillus paracasei]|uniref:BppU family phage baseplate upper protein n=1 Tax=Lacticaseibacillus paracasei TaxID=1597 RepID=UPI00359463F6
MAIRTYKVSLDSKNVITPEPIYLRQGDKTGAVVIDATLMDSGVPIVLNGLTPMFKANTADGKAVIADEGGFSIINSAGGELTYQVPNALTSVAGKVTNAYFSLRDSSGVESTFNIPFVVLEAADATQTAALDYITIIDGANSNVQAIINAHHIIPITDAAPTGSSSIAVQSINGMNWLAVSSKAQGSAGVGIYFAPQIVGLPYPFLFKFKFRSSATDYYSVRAVYANSKGEMLKNDIINRFIAIAGQFTDVKSFFVNEAPADTAIIHLNIVKDEAVASGPGVVYYATDFSLTPKFLKQDATDNVVFSTHFDQGSQPALPLNGSSLSFVKRSSGLAFKNWVTVNSPTTPAASTGMAIYLNINKINQNSGSRILLKFLASSQSAMTLSCDLVYLNSGLQIVGSTHISSNNLLADSSRLKFAFIAQNTIPTGAVYARLQFTDYASESYSFSITDVSIENYFPDVSTASPLLSSPIPALQGQNLFVFGHSFAGPDGPGAGDGQHAPDIFGRINQVSDIDNHAGSGTRSDQILTAVANNWVKNTRGIVWLAGCIRNDQNYFTNNAPNYTTVTRTMMTILAHLTSRDGSNIVQNGNNYDFSFSGDKAYLILPFTKTPSSPITVIDESGQPVATFTTGGYGYDFPGAVTISGLGSGTHQLRANGPVFKVLIPLASTPLIIWEKEPRYNIAVVNGGELANTVSKEYQAEVQSMIQGNFPNVIVLEYPDTWNSALDTNSDGVHPNSSGHNKIARQAQATLLLDGIDFQQGLNWMTGSQADPNPYQIPATNYVAN